MSRKPSLRIDLGEIGPHFDTCAARCGLSPAEALSDLVRRLLLGQIPTSALRTPTPSARTLRRITFESEADRDQLSTLSCDLGSRPGRVVRLAALEQVARQAGGQTNLGPVLPQAGGFGVEPGAAQAGHTRLELRLTNSELTALQAQASDSGHGSVQQLLVAILRAYLTAQPVVGPQVAAELGRVNLALVRIGAGINQVAKACHAGTAGSLGPEDGAKLLAAAQAIEGHARQASDLLLRAQRRWALAPQAGQGEGLVQDH